MHGVIRSSKSRASAFAAACAVASACSDARSPLAPPAASPKESIRMILDSIRSPTAGSQHSCAININHPIGSGSQTICWGQSVGTTINVAVPSAIAGDPGFYKIEAGNNVTCGIVSSSLGNNAYCWGVNTWGQIGDGSTAVRTSPTHVTGGIRFIGITAGGTHSCGIDQNSDAWCWGLNANGQLGNGGTTSSAIPVRVTGGLKFQYISAGNQHTCGQRFNPTLSVGEVYCWGYGGQGQLGTGNTSDQHSPTKVRFTGGATSFGEISSGYNHTCATAPSDIPIQYLYCWGSNTSGQLGDGTRTNRSVPVRVGGTVSRWDSFGAGTEHTCAIEYLHNAPYCWGNGAVGQIGNGSIAFQVLPTPVNGGPNIVKRIFAVGGNHAWGAGESNSWSWGAGGAGQLGNGGSANSLVPVTF